MELWLSNKALVSREEWERKVDELKKQVGADSTLSKEEALIRVEHAFLTAMAQRLPNNHAGIFLSGGVDSSLIALAAQKLGGKFTCYTVGYNGRAEAEDVRFARVMAEKYGFDWKLQLHSLEQVEALLRRSAQILSPAGLLDPVHICVGAVILAAVELAGRDGVTTFLGGLGAEEVFAGYRRHLAVCDVNEECWRGLKAMWATDLRRDAALGSALDVTVLTPFLDEKLIHTAMRVPGELKVVSRERKVILREVAEQYGVPHDVAWRKKKAAQYGSGFDKALEKLARKTGLTKEGYVQSLYLVCAQKQSAFGTTH